MKIYTLIGGVNGVGKSSLSGVLSGERSDLGIIIDTDKITAELGGDKLAGGKLAIKKVNECLDKGISFTQETTLSGKRVLKTVKRAIADDYYIRLYYVGVGSVEESIARIRNRVRKGGHDIPNEYVIRRHSKKFENLAAILPYCNEVRFYDNENGFIEIAEYKNGKLVTKGEATWLEELKGSIL